MIVLFASQTKILEIGTNESPKSSIQALEKCIEKTRPIGTNDFVYLRVRDAVFT